MAFNVHAHCTVLIICDSYKCARRNLPLTPRHVLLSTYRSSTYAAARASWTGLPEYRFAGLKFRLKYVKLPSFTVLTDTHTHYASFLACTCIQYAPASMTCVCVWQASGDSTSLPRLNRKSVYSVRPKSQAHLAGRRSTCYSTCYNLLTVVCSDGS